MKLQRLEPKESKYWQAHQAEIDTLIDEINATTNSKDAGVAVYKLTHFMFRLGRKFEQEDD